MPWRRASPARSTTSACWASSSSSWTARSLVNELAPRPHNSGHWTLDAASTSQFAQQVRAVCGLPLGPVTMTAPAVAMANVLGDLWAAGDPDWSAALADPDVRLHLYGKREPRPGRKMGHLTATAATAEDARRRVLAARTAAARGVASD
ncbi:MAG: ATP-grasp domain-containing protein [Ilumatobacteraceae bacterium]